MNEYKEMLIKAIKRNYFCFYIDNFDDWYWECGNKTVYRRTLKNWVKLIKRNCFLKLKKLLIWGKQLEKRIKQYVDKITEYNYDFLYENLELKKDKDFLITYACYRIMGGGGQVMLGNLNAHRKYIKKGRKKTDFSDYIQVSEKDPTKLYKIEFRPEKDFTIYSSPLGYADIVYEHVYEVPGIVDVVYGDCVLDCGAYVMDTALLFAQKTGITGKVYAFEFVPDNLKMCEKNLALNPHLRDIIETVKFPLAEKSGINLTFNLDSSCTKISEVGDVFTSISIDDFVKQENIKKVDFIKMDIEGSEYSALLGARNTIQIHKPKLAICIYHKKDDPDTIPRLIKEINPNYKFYIGHTGVVDSECVLFAKNMEV